jgi:hypothetical protein
VTPVFFKGILWCSQSGDYPEKNLARILLYLIASEPSSGFGLSLKVQNFTITPSSGFQFFFKISAGFSKELAKN